MVIKEKDVSKLEIPEKLPLLPVRDLVIFPQMIVPLLVGREKSVKSIEEAMLHNHFILLAAQKEAKIDEPEEKDIYQVGTAGEVLQWLKQPDGTAKVLVEGFFRVRIKKYLSKEPFFYVKTERLEEKIEKTPEVEALMRSVAYQFEKYIKLNKRILSETLVSTANIEEPGRLADTIATHLILKINDKQTILEAANPRQRLEKLSQILNRELEILEIESKIEGRVRDQIGKVQKEYYLTEQLKAIQKELGKEEGAEIKELTKKIKEAKMPAEAEEKSLKELSRLAKMPSYSPEGTVVRNYLDWFISLPWSKKTRDNLDISRAQKILDEDHHGLEKVKTRILEYLAVRKLVQKMKGPILCFVGPPGTGKTSVAKSIARSLGRKFVRMSLGGVRDEAEIRGHRRTYIGALPGRIIQSLRKAKSGNPVFLLDEVDKMSMDFRGDPSAALLEVLDPEQNNTFNDHYLEVDFDLSNVMFITTANIQPAIPVPLQDRMEVISFPGYIEEEKAKIARKFLIPKQLKAHGLKEAKLSFSEQALREIIHKHTREAGVRNLEREIANICRKVAKKIVEEKRREKTKVTARNIPSYLGPPKFRHGKAEEKNEIGVATGLAWTEAGGDILSTEVIIVKGKGNLTLTGKLGEVMKESAQAALSYTRSRAKKLKLEEDFYKKIDVHIHVPEGAIPKDGPSAGITMATSLVSTLTKRPVRKDVAMTGEITLRGKVLPIGGLKEKVLAARRAGIGTVILPKENEKDLQEIPPRVKHKLKFILVENMDEVLKIALEK
jgi:ATP-dependent Lon protease